MTKLSTSEREEIIVAAEASFNDVCTLLAAGDRTQNSFGEVRDELAEPIEIDCGFSPKPEYRNERGQVVTLDCDAILRVSLTQAVAVMDVVLCRGKRFTVDGVVEGRTARIVALKAMETSENG